MNYKSNWHAHYAVLKITFLTALIASLLSVSFRPLCTGCFVCYYSVFENGGLRFVGGGTKILII